MDIFSDESKMEMRGKVRKTFFLGSFPPPYGGITVKNELLYGLLREHIDMRPACKCSYGFTLCALLFGDRFVLSPGHTEKLLFLTTLFSIVRPRAMGKSIVFVVGGRLADLVSGDTKMLKRLAKYRRLYIEPTGMYNRLRDMGLSNVRLLPNCRKAPVTDLLPTQSAGAMHCVFFSRVMVEKGANDILEAASRLDEVQFDFYGPMEEDYAEEFKAKIYTLSNVNYKGLFKERDEALYQLLHGYDVLLLPTHFKTEGIPGALVEAKIAALPAIVSDVSYNAEIIEDEVSGIVLKENTVNALTEAIKRLDEDRQLLYALKCGAKQSAESYYIENYMEDILDNLALGGVIHREIIILGTVLGTLHQRRLNFSFECTG